ncbi:TPA: hypothetical protein HA244_01700 [Candidatus Micrarchaeota archaeon]|nr:hypothetical protein [Candidatus Micrarchaeota archaeon]
MVEATLLEARKLMALRAVSDNPQRVLSEESPVRRPIISVGMAPYDNPVVPGIVLEGSLKPSEYPRASLRNLADILSHNANRLSEQNISITLYRYSRNARRIYLSVFSEDERLLEAARKTWLGE